MNHPVEKIIERMSKRDKDLVEELREAGFSDEDLYAALPNPKAAELLKPKNKKAGK
jgi:uncharacterized protein Smg (DUF494 family)